MEQQVLDGYPPDNLFPFSPPLSNPHLLLNLAGIPSIVPLEVTKPSAAAAATGTPANLISTSPPGPDVTNPVALPGLPEDRKR